MQEMLDHSQATGPDLTVGIAVAFYARQDSSLSWPLNQELMRWGLSERRVQMGLRRLEELGELQRQPHEESTRRRRVYRVDPTFRHQLSLLDGSSVRGAPGAGAQQGAPYARAWKEPEEPENRTPLTPLEGGDAPAFTSPAVLSTAERPVQGAGGARRRRRARRAAMRSDFASEPCPLQDPGVEMDGLSSVWAALEERLRAQLGYTFDVWLQGAHVHRLDGDVLVVAVHPLKVQWARDRLGRSIALVSEQPVSLVGCEQLQTAASTRGGSDVQRW